MVLNISTYLKMLGKFSFVRGNRSCKMMHATVLSTKNKEGMPCPQFSCWIEASDGPNTEPGQMCKVEICVPVFYNLWVLTMLIFTIILIGIIISNMAPTRHGLWQWFSNDGLWPNFWWVMECHTNHADLLGYGAFMFCFVLTQKACL